MPEPSIPPDLPREMMPDLLRNWFLGSAARRYMSRKRYASVVRSSGVPRGRARSLDVGCGWGYGIFLMRGRGFSPCGIDIVRDDFPAARRIGAANGYDPALVCADVSALPFADASFSVVTSVETFEHVFAPDREAAAREIARVLEPGGLLVLSTPNYHSPVEFAKRVIARLPFLKRLLPTMCYPVGDIDRLDYHPYRYHLPLRTGEVRTLLAGAGFRVEEVKRIIFVLKSTPDWLVPFCRMLEGGLETIPVLRLLGGTLVVRARLPA